jgi:general secretion pathway protein G
MRKTTSGFTIVELLVVIVVIAILAAITIVAYNGIQNRAYDSAVQADLSNLSKKYELYKATNDKYPSGDYAAIESVDNGLYSLTMNKSAYNTTSVYYNLLPCTTSDASSYAFLTTSKSGKRLYIGNTTGSVKEYTGAVSWASSDYNAMCVSVLAGSAAAINVAGYRTDASPQWRAWTS